MAPLLAASAEYEPTREAAVGLLRGVLRELEAHGTSTDPSIAVEVMRTYAALAREEPHPDKRAELWRKSLAIASRFDSPAVVDCLAEVSVDASQDPYSTLSTRDRLTLLGAAKRSLDDAIGCVTEPGTTAQLLGRKAAVLRQRSTFEGRARGRQAAQPTVQAAERCAKRAVALNRRAPLLVEAGLCAWHRGRWSSDDAMYKGAIEEAEELILEAASDLDLARLALAYLHRMTFRHSEAAAAYLRFAESTARVRLVYRNSHLLSDSTIGLWYTLRPTGVLPDELPAALNLAERSIAAGYDDARNLLCLAFLRGITEPANIEIDDLTESLGVAGFDWNDLADRVSAPGDGVVGVLARGMNHGGTWSRIATFVSTFAADVDLATEIARVGAQLGPHDPIVLTNYARLLITRDGPAASRRRATRLLDQAAQFADRRFMWWRLVRAELDEASVATPSSTSAIDRVERLSRLQDVAKAFRQLEGIPDPAERGRRFEAFFATLARLTLAVSEGSYVTHRADGTRRQWDGHVECGGHSYRVELKWEGSPLEEKSVSHFLDGIEPATCGGLIFSMSGFAPGAVSRARREATEKRAVLLIGESEARQVFLAYTRLDDLILRRRRIFDKTGDPYPPLDTSVVDADMPMS
jgi:hypothetical protein